MSHAVINTQDRGFSGIVDANGVTLPTEMLNLLGEIEVCLNCLVFVYETCCCSVDDVVADVEGDADLADAISRYANAKDYVDKLPTFRKDEAEFIYHNMYIKASALTWQQVLSEFNATPKVLLLDGLRAPGKILLIVYHRGFQKEIPNDPDWRRL